jgi:hypothetical protein
MSFDLSNFYYFPEHFKGICMIDTKTQPIVANRDCTPMTSTHVDADYLCQLKVGKNIAGRKLAFDTTKKFSQHSILGRLEVNFFVADNGFMLTYRNDGSTACESVFCFNPITQMEETIYTINKNGSKWIKTEPLSFGTQHHICISVNDPMLIPNVTCRNFLTTFKLI